MTRKGLNLQRDNLSKVGGGPLSRFLLLPGIVILWLEYMNTGKKSYARIRQDGRRAKSPLMVVFYSLAFWAAAIALLLSWYYKPR
jgi:hypothetical protein